ncbi:PREDICTED: uncharacterized protein LOC108968754 [Bactrocera latifrons]|uniref:uncharacterized protein LOC108968754 n=1 Tax=Bactrocera latifrons TaxID=174628 RepID=UPI0008DD96E1|nr:PREDICTED: uncharacterized protein LOC108968754 [Bactrocera latifrons]
MNQGHLNRTFKNARLTAEELTTVLVEIGAVLNSWPLTPLSSDPNDYKALTPGHFIIGSALRALPERRLSAEISSLNRWNQVTSIKQTFWNRWSNDYINELQIRSKWYSVQSKINNNSMVIIHEHNLPLQKWPIGMVINCIPGKDSKLRVMDIRTTQGIIRRTIHKLALGVIQLNAVNNCICIVFNDMFRSRNYTYVCFCTLVNPISM